MIESALFEDIEDLNVGEYNILSAPQGKILVEVKYKKERSGFEIDHEIICTHAVERVVEAVAVGPELEYLKGKRLWVSHTIGSRFRNIKLNGKNYYVIVPSMVFAYEVENGEWSTIKDSGFTIVKSVEERIEGNKYFEFGEEETKNYVSGLGIDKEGRYIYFNPKSQYIYEIDGVKYTRFRNRHKLFESSNRIDIQFPKFVEKNNSGKNQY